MHGWVASAKAAVELQRNEEKEERARERRQRAATVGTGKLHAEIAVAAERNGVSITRLTVLSTRLDPYRRDTTDGHRDGRWFADQITPLPADMSRYQSSTRMRAAR
jgi:hypothetical protein